MRKHWIKIAIAAVVVVAAIIVWDMYHQNRFSRYKNEQFSFVDTQESIKKDIKIYASLDEKSTTIVYDSIGWKYRDSTRLIEVFDGKEFHPFPKNYTSAHFFITLDGKNYGQVAYQKTNPGIASSIVISVKYKPRQGEEAEDKYLSDWIYDIKIASNDINGVGSISGTAWRMYPMFSQMVFEFANSTSSVELIGEKL
jgi:hypothetical protein